MIPALIVGGFTAWYLGLKAGVIAAAVSFVGLLAASFLPIPGATLVAWALLLGWCALLFFFGRAMGNRGTTKQSFRASVLADASSVASRVRQLFGR